MAILGRKKKLKTAFNSTFSLLIIILLFLMSEMDIVLSVI